MKKLTERLSQYFEENPPNLGDAESILDALFWMYMEYCPADSETIKALYVQLRKIMNLPPECYDQVFDIVSDLCVEHGRKAFREGLRLGVVLIKELEC